MQVNELVRQVKQHVEDIEDAERDGKEAFVIARVVALREFLSSQPVVEALCA